MHKWMIYGANGYTGRIICGLLAGRGFKPVLAGRNASAVQELAAQYELEGRPFALESVEQVREQIRGCKLVLHCAGPFVETSALMAAACIAEKAHYLDITGEIPVFSARAEDDGAARAAGVMLMPGVGFDIVPTDCLAVALKNRLPEATHLQLAFHALSNASGGTTRSALAQMPKGGRVRENGELRRIPHLSRSVRARFGDEQTTVYSVPWGDVFTAYYSTGVGNIEVFTVFPKSQALLVKLARPALGLLKFGPVLRAAQSMVGHSGPSAEARQQGSSHVWGRIWNHEREVEGQLRTVEGYQFTALSALCIVERVLAGDFQPGYRTPGGLYGEKLVLEIAGTEYGTFVERSRV